MDETRHRLSRDGAVVLELGGLRAHELASVAHTVVGVSLDSEAFRVGADRVLGVSKGKRSTEGKFERIRQSYVHSRYPNRTSGRVASEEEEEVAQRTQNTTYTEHNKQEKRGEKKGKKRGGQFIGRHAELWKSVEPRRGSYHRHTLRVAGVGMVKP